jgi:hypothetical protein
MDVPRYIDGVRLTQVAEQDLTLIAPAVPIGSKAQAKRPRWVAIGQYPTDDAAVLLTCDSQWRALSAERFGTVFEAIKAAQDRYARRLKWSLVSDKGTLT